MAQGSRDEERERETDRVREREKPAMPSAGDFCMSLIIKMREKRTRFSARNQPSRAANT